MAKVQSDLVTYSNLSFTPALLDSTLVVEPPLPSALLIPTDP